MTQTLSLGFGYWELELICLLACLREAPPPEALRRAGAPAKAGAWCLVIIVLFHHYLLPTDHCLLLTVLITT
jgi:hypothetical protein